MDLARLDGLAQQGVEHDHPILLLVERAFEPAAVGEAGMLVHRFDGRFVVAAAHGLEDAVLGFIPLFQHRDRDLFLELRLVEIPDIRQELEGQELLDFLHVQRFLVEHHPHEDPDGGIEIVGFQHLDAVVVFLNSTLPGFAQIALDPFAGFFASGSERPRSDQKNGVLLIWDAEERKVEFKRSFDKKESLFRGAVQQELAEFLPVELRVQRPPQTVIKFFQSLKGRFHPPGGDILRCCQLGKDLQWIDPHDLHRSFTHLLLKFYLIY